MLGGEPELVVAGTFVSPWGNHLYCWCRWCRDGWCVAPYKRWRSDGVSQIVRCPTCGAVRSVLALLDDVAAMATWPPRIVKKPVPKPEPRPEPAPVPEPPPRPVDPDDPFAVPPPCDRAAAVRLVAAVEPEEPDMITPFVPAWPALATRAPGRARRRAS